MIYLFSGTPGSGKSLDLARMIYSENIHTPFIVNFPLNAPNMENIFCISNWENVSPVDLVDFADKWFAKHPFHEGAIKVVIDECQIYYNSREWSKSNRLDWLRFFSNHRHFGFDIYLCCQYDRMIDRQIRCLIEIEFLHRKVNNLGWRGAFLRLVAAAPTLFMVNKFYYPLKLPEGTQVFRYHKRLAKLYDSYDRNFVAGVGGCPRHELRLDDSTDSASECTFDNVADFDDYFIDETQCG